MQKGNINSFENADFYTLCTTAYGDKVNLGLVTCSCWHVLSCWKQIIFHIEQVQHRQQQKKQSLPICFSLIQERDLSRVKKWFNSGLIPFFVSFPVTTNKGSDQCGGNICSLKTPLRLPSTLHTNHHSLHIMVICSHCLTWHWLGACVYYKIWQQITTATGKLAKCVPTHTASGGCTWLQYNQCACKGQIC